MSEVQKSFPELTAPAGWRVSEFCTKAPMSKATFWRLVKKGLIRTIKYGGTTIIPAAEAERIFLNGTKSAA
jgi:hypothetical protein